MKKTLFHISLFSLIIYLSGCSPKGTFTEPLLYSQTFKGNKIVTTEKLEALLPQRPNKRILKTPLTLGLYFHQLFAQNYPKQKIKWQNELTKLNEDFDREANKIDNNSVEFLQLSKKKESKAQKLTKKINEGNWGMRTFGEPPSYFYEEDAKKNVEKVKTYYKNHGFFNYSVSYKADSLFFKKRSIAVTYLVNEGNYYPFYKTDSLVTPDKAIYAILKENQKQSLLKNGNRLEVETYNAEKARIEELLKNNGYYHFTKDNISIRINDLDTAITKGIAAITFIPNPDRPPQNPNYNKSYLLNKVTFISDGTSPNIPNSKVDTVVFNNIKYLFVNKRFSEKLLDTKIDIRPNEHYSLQKVLLTQKKLYGLDQFQFTRVNFDTTKGVLDATIYAKPLDKYQFTAETGGSIYKLVLGPFFNTSFKLRNLRGSASSLETNFRFGFEAQAGFIRPDIVSRNLELGFNSSIIIPKILAPNFIAQRLNDYTPQTRLGGGVEFVGRQEYNRLNFKINETYLWRPSPNKFWQVSLIDLNLLSTSYPNNQQARDFKNFLDSLQRYAGNNLGRSFNKSFVSSISASYTYTDNPYGQITKGNYIRLLLESGGTTLNFFPKGKIGFVSDIFGDSLQFYRFLKINVDYRKYITLNPTGNSIFVYKVNTGLAYAYGTERGLPYEKNFFVGGPNSLRAWKPRGLGPGSAQGNFDQPGSILLEASAEYRFKILRFYGDYNINGAFFVDAGNVWRFKGQNTEGVSGSDFQFNRFYKEIAVGTGFGIRVDLSFFVLRLDWAVRMLDPSLPENNRWVLFKPSEKLPSTYRNPLVLNFGIGYPF
ncbi:MULTISPECIES: BamA/TamA family outer membrane protein [unclassified Arcicella]|uniref:translocation and assembly module lipoprotein TamL n=1 Tax=unclassified Arcicella TaxID=2644986 RepID=UPI00285B9E74|nr:MULTISPECIES: BamA/TamA family outer membrane protein [unclassified Arcicella]MDR6562599.1 outer membrane protein assembly factor BamA [Arcicella sp. BE51]MDR6812686.1 outer membrane protein assembly factor BamA [Arcicella sp. BE140]MDR6823998.1 outer membrane protein assembly factor BamA [Arcicella sp. BE139]